jgi:hypothetical protein
LLHQARKSNFDVSSELSRLLGFVGGPMADLASNSRVLSAFIDAVWQECRDDLKIKRIGSEAFDALTRGRQEDQRLIVLLVLKQIRLRKLLMRAHALGWLIGHSIGLPYLDELLQMQKDFLARCPWLWKA